MGGPIPQGKRFGKAKAGELEKLGKCRGVNFLIPFRSFTQFFFFSTLAYTKRFPSLNHTTTSQL